MVVRSLIWFLIGVFVGVCLLSLFAMSSYCSRTEEINGLRVALGDLVRACEEATGGADVYARVTGLAEPLRRARKVLER